MTNSIDERLAKLNAKAADKVARRLEIKHKLEAKERKRKPNEPNYLTAKQIREARTSFGIQAQCMICGKKKPLKKSHAIDHCHVTGTVRGILCYNCNMGLGYFKDDLEIMKSALRYMEYHKLSPDALTDEEVERLRSIQNR